MNLREEILVLSEEEVKDRTKDPRWVKYFRKMFDELYEKQLEKTGKSFEEFAGSDDYDRWAEKEIFPMFKEPKNGPSVKKIFEKWEQDLLFDLD